MTKRKTIALLITVMMMFSACGDLTDEGKSVEKESLNTGFSVTGSESYDSFDIPVVVGIDDQDRKISFLNLDTGRQYTLNIDGTSKFYDKYGQVISLAQLKLGDVVDVIFLKNTKHLVKLNLSSSAWKYDNVEKYEIDTVRREVSIGGGIYKLSEYASFFSDGRKIDLMELNSADILTFQGIDNAVLCVTVEKGHGYLRLANAESFVGGWIELGQKQIQRITEDMLLTVPEGSYQVNISYKGSGETKNVIINRDEETTLDIGDLKITEAQKGNVLFSLVPSTARLYIDGAVTDVSQPVTLEYGIHQLIARAEGYQTLTQYLRVGEESANINIELDEVTVEEEGSTESTETQSTEAESTENTVSGNDAESSASAAAAADYYKVYIDSPEGAEVYLDGSYVGIAPVNFKKTEGTHVIILRKNGFETRSYTIQIDNENKDISYSFAELESSQ